MLAGVALAGAAAWSSAAPGRSRSPSSAAHEVAGEPPTPLPSTGSRASVVAPNGWSLPFTVVDGVKVFHLVAEEVEHEFAPGLQARCWGYNGSVHGPVIEAVEGDRVRIYLTNLLAAPTTVHWHGLFLPSGMDGVGGLSQPAVPPGGTCVYEFTLRQHGTFMYHSHHDEMTQMGMGMTGLFIVHPASPPSAGPDRDFAIMLHEWFLPVGASRPDPNEIGDFNVLTMNGRCFPGTAPLVVRRGDRVRIRLGNLSAMNHHPIHLHGHAFTVVETDGGVVPESARRPETTVLVPVGSTRTVEFVADAPGDWALHCHMTHHVMNQMGHGVTNMIGVDAAGLDELIRPLLPGYMTMGENGMGDMADMGMRVPENSIPMVGGRGPGGAITMGGMFTILKVRDEVAEGQTDPGWYENPPGTQSWPAEESALRRDGIDASGERAPRGGDRSGPASTGRQPDGSGHGAMHH